MGRFFSDRVEMALKDIYYDLTAGRGHEGFQLLQEAAQEGDADACCLLARCLYGPEYTWPGHNFPVDGRAGDQLMRHSVLGGSAMGALLSLRSGVVSRQLAQAMPFTLQEAFDTVLDKAERGEPFCQMLIGNVYFWGDFVTIQDRSQADLGADAFQSYLRENYAKCEDWLWRAYRNGVSLACLNLSNFYRNGKPGLISPRPEREREVDRHGAEKGYPDVMCFYADDIYGDNRAEAFEFYRRSAKLGEPRAFFWAGYSYELGEGVPKDDASAADYYQRALAAPIQSKISPANRLGSFYFRGEGVERDYAKALTYLDKVNWNCHPAFYLLGKMYCNGLGVPMDIAKGVEYLQKASEVPEAKEELRHYKKTLFGKWVRR